MNLFNVYYSIVTQLANGKEPELTKFTTYSLYQALLPLYSDQSTWNEFKMLVNMVSGGKWVIRDEKHQPYLGQNRKVFHLCQESGSNIVCIFDLENNTIKFQK